MIEEKLNRILPGGLNDSIGLHVRLQRSIHELPEGVANNILDDFERTLTNSKSEIRNPAAYLSTVIQRTANNLAADRLYPKIIPPAIQHRLNLLFSRFCRPEELDRRCKDILLEMSEADALLALDELEFHDRSTIKNISAYFVSVAQKYLKKNIGGPGRVSSKEAELHDMLPAPPYMPRDLLFGYGNDEYVPEMTRPFTKPATKRVC